VVWLRVLSRTNLAYSPRRSTPNLRFFILLHPLCRSQKSQLLWNQANPDSFAKTPGVGSSVLSVNSVVSRSSPRFRRSTPNPRFFILLQTRCRSQKSQLLWNQANPVYPPVSWRASFPKMPGCGVGHPERNYGTPGCGGTHARLAFRISHSYPLLCVALAASACPDPIGASLYPACPKFRGEPRRGRYLFPRFSPASGHAARFARHWPLATFFYLPLESTLAKCIKTNDFNSL